MIKTQELCLDQPTGLPMTEIHRLTSPQCPYVKSTAGPRNLLKNPVPKGVLSKGPTCFRCGEKGHRNQDCRFLNERCFRCGKRGHTRHMCKFPSFVSKGSTVNPIVTTVTNPVCTPWKIELETEGKPVVMETDTGTAVSLISETSYRRLFPQKRLTESNEKLTTYTGQRVPVKGLIFVKVVHAGREEVLPLLVVDSGGSKLPKLLGRN